MNEKQKSFLQELRRLLDKSLSQGSIPELIGDYSKNESKKNEIGIALCFWSFIRSIEKRFYDTFKEEEIAHDIYWQTKREFLKQFISDQRPYFALIAKVESMPSRVFRRMLWFYNINFASFEAFLRRLAESEVEGINETHEALFQVNGPEVPRCFTEGWKNSIRQYFKKYRTTKDNILKESFKDAESRYLSKGTIAYEFFGIDFGFNKYPEENTDTRVSESLMMQFLSNKNRDNDFVVNQEDGVYWWLYKTIRSNYIWHPKREVELNKAICPGFWYTIIMWMLILFISPVMLVSSVLGVSAGVSMWVTVPALALGSITPLILLAAAIKYVFVAIWKRVFRFFEGFEMDVDEDFFKEFFKIFWGIALASIIACVVAAVGTAMYFWFYESVALAAYLTLFIAMYIFYMLYKEKAKWPTSVPVLGIPTVIFVAGKVLFDFRHFFFEYANTITALLALAGIIAACVYVLMRLDDLEKTASLKNESVYKKFEMIYKISSIVAWSIMAVTLGGSIYVITSYDMYGQFAYLFFFMGAFMLVSFLFIFVSWRFFEPKKNRFALNFAIDASEEDEFLTEFYRNLMFYNPWLKNEADAKEKAAKIAAFVSLYYSMSSAPKRLLFISKEAFSLIDEYKSGMFQKRINDKDDKDLFVSFMLRRVSFKEAYETFLRAESKKRVFNRKLEKILESIENFFNRFILNPIVFVIKKIGVFIETCRTLWEIFNEKCPYVSRPKILQ